MSSDAQRTQGTPRNAALRWVAESFGFSNPYEVALLEGARLSEVMRHAASEAQARAVDALEGSGCDCPTVRAA